MYPSLIWFGLLLLSVLAAYAMRRRPWYVLAWFVALAIIGWLMPPFVHHVYCGTVQTSSIVGETSATLKCVEYAVPDPYAFLEKTLSTLMFIITVVIGIYMALKEGVFGRLW